MARPLPITLEAIDAAWLTRALGFTVLDSAIVEVIRGTCTKIRVRLVMDEAGKRTGIPETVILKGGFEPHSREHTFLLQVEPYGYRDLLPDSGLNTPTCYFADYDVESRQGIVIMEDLARRGVTFGDPMKPRTHDLVARSLSLLAGYHAQNWNCPEFAAGDRLGWIETAPPFSRDVMQPYLEPEAWYGYVAMPRGAASSNRFHDREWAVDALKRMERLSSQVPNTVIHGDSHLGNTFVEPDGTPGFYDIVPRRAPAMAEVCYHIALTMDVAERPRWERELVGHYLEELRRHGVTDPPSLDEAMHQHGAFLIEGFCLVLTNDAYFMPEAPITAYAARFSQAMLDNDTMGRLARVAQ